MKYIVIWGGTFGMFSFVHIQTNNEYSYIEMCIKKQSI